MQHRPRRSSSYFDRYVVLTSKDGSQIRHQLSEAIYERAVPLEVGLVRITYPSGWFYPIGDFQFTVYAHSQVAELPHFSMNPYYQKTDIALASLENERGDLENEILPIINESISKQMNTAMDTFNRSIKSVGHQPMDQHIAGSEFLRLIWDEHIQRLKFIDPSFNDRIDALPTEIGCFKGEQLWKIFGFDQFVGNHDGEMHKLPVTALRAPTLASNTPIMNIFTPNLIKVRVVNNTYQPLLDIIPVKKPQSNKPIGHYQVTQEIEKPTYQPLLSGYINEILLEIRDNNNLLIPLSSGQYIITLHFRSSQK